MQGSNLQNPPSTSDSLSSPSRDNQEPTDSLLLPKSQETWEEPRKSVEFSQSSIKPKPVPSFPPQTLENERSLEGNGRSIEFSDGHHQRIVFPSPELPPVQFPNLDEGEKKIVNDQSDSQHVDNNKIDSISMLTNPQSASEGQQSIKEISNGGDVDQTSLPEIEFGSNYVDDDAVVASQISAAGIDSYRPSFTRNDLKKRVRGSPISSSATSQDNSKDDDDSKVKQATHSVLENQLVLVVGSLTIVALVLILLIVLLLCRFVCYFCPQIFPCFSNVVPSRLSML